MDTTLLLILQITSQLSLAAAAWWLAGNHLPISRSASRHWMVFCVSGAAAGALSSWARPLPPAVLTVVNLLLGLAVVANARGLTRFLDRAPRDREFAAVLAGLLLVGGADMAGAVAPHARAMAASSLLGAALARSAWLTWPGLQAEFGRRLAALVVVPQILAAGLFALRVADLAFGSVSAADVQMSAHAGRNLSTLMGLSVLMWTFNLMLAALVVLRLVQRLNQLSQHDALTGLPNRREMLRRYQDLRARLGQRGARFGLLLLDLDHFKRVNDSLGHAAGDDALRHAASVLAGAAAGWPGAAKPPLLARLGGEEFCVLLEAPAIASAADLAEHMRAALAAAPLAWSGHTLQLTTSVGVALVEHTNEPFEQALQRADEALYRAKNGGRNRVCMASEPGATAHRAAAKKPPRDSAAPWPIKSASPH